MYLNNKILNIGLPRTGTYSLNVALKNLGFSCIHYPNKIEEIKNYQAACEVRFEYIELEKNFPNSMYIYTYRDFDSWIRSCYNHKKNFQKGWNPFWLKANWDEIYFQKQDSLKFFENKKDRFLFFNVFENDKWEKLCAFLNKRIPNIKYPHLNYSKM
jgi:hypothetical protein